MNTCPDERQTKNIQSARRNREDNAENCSCCLIIISTWDTIFRMETLLIESDDDRRDNHLRGCKSNLPDGISIRYKVPSPGSCHSSVADSAIVTKFENNKDMSRVKTLENRAMRPVQLSFNST